MADKMQSESTAQDSTQRMRRVGNTMEAGALIKESRKKQSIRQDDIGEMIGASLMFAMWRRANRLQIGVGCSHCVRSWALRSIFGFPRIG